MPGFSSALGVARNTHAPGSGCPAAAADETDEVLAGSQSADRLRPVLAGNRRRIVAVLPDAEARKRHTSVVGNDARDLGAGRQVCVHVAGPLSGGDRNGMSQLHAKEAAGVAAVGSELHAVPAGRHPGEHVSAVAVGDDPELTQVWIVDRGDKDADTPEALASCLGPDRSREGPAGAQPGIDVACVLAGPQM